MNELSLTDYKFIISLVLLKFFISFDLSICTLAVEAERIQSGILNVFNLWLSKAKQTKLSIKFEYFFKKVKSPLIDDYMLIRIQCPTDWFCLKDRLRKPVKQ